MTAITPDQMVEENEPAGGPCGPKRALWISEAGGLSQFGAFIEILPPGSRSSIRHWHSAEDEMIFVIEGQVALLEGTSETVLNPGDAATFRAGDPVGHCLENRGTRPTRCLVVGTRADADVITYPDHDRICVRRGGEDSWTDLAGRPATNPYAEVPAPRGEGSAGRGEA